MQQQTASEERMGGAGVWGGARPRIYGRREPGAGSREGGSQRPAVEYSVGGGVGFFSCGGLRVKRARRHMWHRIMGRASCFLDGPRPFPPPQKDGDPVTCGEPGARHCRGPTELSESLA